MAPSPVVHPFFDQATNTWSYIVHAPGDRRCAVIDPVLDFDPASGRVSHACVDRLDAHIRRHGLELQWVLETHVHADHLSGATELVRRFGGRVGIGAGVVQVQAVFAGLFNAEVAFRRDGSQFDHRFEDGETLRIGALEIEVLYTPGHTPACVAYRCADAVFVGDTLFMPDYGTARCDFPGGDPRTLFRSIRRLLALPPRTRMFLCHDYLPGQRTDYRASTTVAEQRAGNIHAHDGIDEEAFVAMREARDAGLPAPRLLLPSVQFNMRGAHLPPAEANGTHYLKIPVRLPPLRGRDEAAA